MLWPTVAPAKPNWPVVSMLARRLFLGWRDDLRLARGIVSRLWLSASRPACFARGSEFGECLFSHHCQRLLGISCGIGGGLRWASAPSFFDRLRARESHSTPFRWALRERASA
jgi:hypothetical protein